MDDIYLIIKDLIRKFETQISDHMFFMASGGLMVDPLSKIQALCEIFLFVINSHNNESETICNTDQQTASSCGRFAKKRTTTITITKSPDVVIH